MKPTILFSNFNYLKTCLCHNLIVQLMAEGKKQMKVDKSLNIWNILGLGILNGNTIFCYFLYVNSLILLLQSQMGYTHQCSFLHCGPVHIRHHTHSGTSLEGSGTFQTRRCSGNYTHQCLWQRKPEREKVSNTT